MGAPGKVFKNQYLGSIKLRLLPSRPSLMPAVYDDPMDTRLLHKLELYFSPVNRHPEELLLHQGS